MVDQPLSSRPRATITLPLAPSTTDCKPLSSRLGLDNESAKPTRKVVLGILETPGDSHHGAAWRGMSRQVPRNFVDVFAPSCLPSLHSCKTPPDVQTRLCNIGHMPKACPCMLEPFRRRRLSEQKWIQDTRAIPTSYLLVLTLALCSDLRQALTNLIDPFDLSGKPPCTDNTRPAHLPVTNHRGQCIVQARAAHVGERPLFLFNRLVCDIALAPVQARRICETFLHGPQTNAHGTPVTV